MNRRFAVVVGSLAASAAFAWAGDEPVKYEIKWTERWTAGQTVTTTEHETTTNSTTMGGKSMPTQPESLDTTYVVRCDEADANGVPTKQTVFVKSFKNVKGGRTDESISGVRFTVAGNVWTLPEGKTAGPLAKKWLDGTFAKKNRDPLSSFAPPSMSVGETWKPDAKTVAEAFARVLEDAPFDMARAAMEVKLVAAEGTPPDATGKMEVKVHLPIGDKVPGLPPGAVVSNDSGAEVTGRRAGPLTKSTMLGESHLSMVLTMNVEVKQGAQTITVETKANGSQDKTTVDGGEIPAADAAPPTAPAGPGGGK